MHRRDDQDYLGHDAMTPDNSKLADLRTILTSLGQGADVADLSDDQLAALVEKQDEITGQAERVKELIDLIVSAFNDQRVIALDVQKNGNLQFIHIATLAPDAKPGHLGETKEVTPEQQILLQSIFGPGSEAHKRYHEHKDKGKQS